MERSGTVGKDQSDRLLPLQLAEAVDDVGDLLVGLNVDKFGEGLHIC